MILFAGWLPWVMSDGAMKHPAVIVSAFHVIQEVGGRRRGLHWIERQLDLTQLGFQQKRGVLTARHDAHPTEWSETNEKNGGRVRS